MSYDVYMKDAPQGASLRTRFSAQGGMYQVGGSHECWLNVTYNYCESFRAALHPDGLWWLGGKQGRHVANRLFCAVKRLGITTDDNYWARTPGTAGDALRALLLWAIEHPNGWFEVI